MIVQFYSVFSIVKKCEEPPNTAQKVLMAKKVNIGGHI